MDTRHNAALRFVERWLLDNIELDASPVETPDDPRPADLAARCLKDAAAAGLSQGDLIEACGDLPERVRQALTGGA